MAEARAAAERAFDNWIERYQDKYPKVAACLARDRDELLAFYDFPAAHWTHLRTTNAIESLNSTVRRAVRTRGHFPNDRAATKLLYLALRGVQHGWRTAPLFWPQARIEFAIRFGDRFVVGS